MSTGLIVLLIFVACAAYTHIRGKVKFPLRRQITTHTNLLAPVNALWYLFSSVPRTPFLDPGEFPDLAPLQANWKVIRDEVRALHQGGGIRPFDAMNDLSFHEFFKRGWTRFYLSWYGHELPSAQQTCPQTMALLRQARSVRAAMFAVLPPGGKLKPHRDPYAGSLRYHLGLVTPNDDACGIHVDGEFYSWRDGEGVMFDETYIHWAKNDTQTHRIILFCDVERPLHTRVARWLNRVIGGFLGSGTVARNRPDEQLGLLNRLVPRLYFIRRMGEPLKNANRPLYYALKFGVYAGVIYLLFLRNVIERFKDSSIATLVNSQIG